MERPTLLDFTPAPSRNRHSGWTADRQRRFIAELAMVGDVGVAAVAAGRSRQSAYALSERPGGESFAAAWDQALALFAASDRMHDVVTVLPGGLETLLVPRFYRGRLIGFVARENDRDLLRRLGQLERWRAAKQDKGDTPDPAGPKLCHVSRGGEVD